VFVSPQDRGNLEPFCDGEFEVWAMENFLPAIKWARPVPARFNPEAKMDLVWQTQAIPDSWGTILTALPWLAALLTVAVLLLWLLAAALVFRECRPR
jgi:hypothetical protein